MSAYAIQPESSAMKYNECPNCGTRWTPPELGCPKCQDATNPAPTPRTDAAEAEVKGDYQELPVTDLARTLERELTSAQAALAAKDAEIARRKAQLDMWTSAAMDGNAAIAQLTTRAEKAEASLATSVAFVARLQERQRELMEEAGELWHERDALRAEVERLKAHEGDLVIGSAILNGARQQEAESVDQLRAALAAAKGDARSYKAARDFELANLTETRRQLAAAKEDADLLTWFEDWGYKDSIGWVLALPDNQYGQTRDIRAAIDAARKARP